MTTQESLLQLSVGSKLCFCAIDGQPRQGSIPIFTFHCRQRVFNLRINVMLSTRDLSLLTHQSPNNANKMLQLFIIEKHFPPMYPVYKEFEQQRTVDYLSSSWPTISKCNSLNNSVTNLK